MGDETVPHDASPQRPTRVRYAVVGLATLMAVLLYLDRFCLGFLLTYINEEFAVTDFWAGVLLSIFFFSYAACQVPSGWLSDRFGARLMLALYIAGWSLFTGLLGLSGSFALLLLFRLLAGAAQAGAYPTSAGMISKWVPFTARATASGIVSLGGRAGGVLAPLLTAYLLIAFVPVSVPSGLTENDLLDLAGLLNEVKETTKGPAAPLAAVIREQRADSPAPAKELSEERQRQIAAEWNDILRRRDLYRMVDLEQFNLPSEAWSLARVPEDELTEEQLVRRNRLLLEAAFPKHIRKIYGQGWRPVAIAYGVAGLLIAALFWFGVRNHPAEHPACNTAEQALIDSGRLVPTSPHGRVGGVPLYYIVRSRSLWLSSVSQFGTNFGWAFLMLLLPTYLVEVHRVPPLERGVMSGLPVAVGMIGMFAGGWLTDRLTRRLGVLWGRRLPMALTRFGAMAAYLACMALGDPWLVTVAFCFVAFSIDLGTASVWAFKQDVGGRHVGSVLGWGNMWGNFGGMLSPLVLLAIGGPYQWELRFLACAAAFAIAGVAAMGVNATVPIMPPDQE